MTGIAETLHRIMPIIAATVAGGLLGASGAPPFVQLAEGARATMQLIGEMRQERPYILERIAYQGTGLVTNLADKVEPGNTLVEGIMPGGTQIRLLDPNGKELHRWKADFFKFWPDAHDVFSERSVPKSHNNYFIQGMWPLTDGSVILNFGQLGAVRLDKCSNLMWRSDRPTHHSVTPTEDGNFWIPGVIAVADTPDEYLPAIYTREQITTMIADSTSKGYNNSVLLFDAKGHVLKEFSLVKAVYDAGLEHAIYASLQEIPADPIHANDIEIVTQELAARLGKPDVKAGDLLVSMREMNMIAVIDEDDGRLKWHHEGPWVRQHDVDITPDGMIELFNNRSKYIGHHVDTSQVLRFDPRTGSVEVVAPVGEKDKFFTHIMGTNQSLANGNRLIAETTAGRVFEVTPSGEVVWDYRLPYDDVAASLLTNAMRIPEDFFEKDALKCPA